MRAFFLPAFLFFVSSSFSGYFENPTLRYLHPTPTPADIYSMFWISPTCGVIATDCGELLRTTDGGNTFSFGIIDPAISGSPYINDVFFLNDNHGWAVADNRKLLETQNGGLTWECSTIGSYSDLLGVEFIDEQCGTVVSSNNHILRTINGGTTWNSQSVTGGGDWYDVHFNNSSEGWVVGSSGIAYTNTAGAFWEIQTSGSFRAVDFTSLDNGWAVGDFGNVVHTSDGGITWEQVDIPGDFNTLTDVDFWSEYEGWISGDGYPSGWSLPVVFHTVDGGQNWSLDTLQTPYSNPEYRNGWAVFATDDGCCYFAGERGMLHYTQDGGSNWNMITRSVSYDYTTNVFFSSIESGWAISYQSIIRTLDGGLNWEDITPSFGSTPFFSALFFSPDGLHGWVGGYSGFLMRTDDGGYTWTELTSGFTTNTSDIEFNSSGFGIATSSTGVRQSHDWGDTWEEVPIAGEFRDIEFIDDTSGYVGGWNGMMLRFDDQGDSWCDLNFPISNYGIEDICAINNNVVFVAGYGPPGSTGAILRSVNGGGSWQAIYTGISVEIFESIYFKDINSGILLDVNSLAAVTDDGGASWTQYNISGPTFVNTAKKAFFLDYEHAWLPSPGVMELSFSSTGLEEGSSSLIRSEYFTITPCPVRDESPSVAFSIPTTGNYMLDIYDLTGRVVLHQNYVNLPAGEHSIPLDTANLPSAVYLCTLSKDGFFRNTKMILVPE